MNSIPFPRLALALLSLGALTAPLSAQAPSRTEINHFLESYMEAAVGPDPRQELRHYAGRVDYFGHGVVGADFIARDQYRYYARWPVRSFTVLEGPNVLSVDEEGATISFRLRYDLTGPSGQVSGETNNTMVLRRIEGYLHIVGISEQKRGEAPAPVAAVTEPRTKVTREVEDREPAPAPAPAAPKPEPKPVAVKKPAEKEHFIVGNTEPEEEKKPAPRVARKEEKPAAKPEPEPKTPKSAPKVAKKEAPSTTVGANSSGSTLDTAYAIPNVPGFVYPPGVERVPENMLDVRGMKSGQAAKDPRTGKQFLVP